MSKPKLQIIVLFQNLGENQAYFARSPAPLLESLNEPSLSSVHKNQNKVEGYKELFEKLKKRGILTTIIDFFSFSEKCGQPRLFTQMGSSGENGGKLRCLSPLFTIRF